MRTVSFVRILLAQLLLVFSVNQVLAAACVDNPLSDEAISRFKADPKAVVAPGADARAIEGHVMDLASTDASLSSDIVRLAKGTTPAFRLAIAAGLARAALACSSIDQQAALLIQQAVAGLDDGEFQSAFAAVAGDLSTAATDAAFSSAVSAVGSVVVVNKNVTPGLPKSPIGGGKAAIFEIGSSGIMTTGRSNVSTSSTAATPVSATR